MTKRLPIGCSKSEYLFQELSWRVSVLHMSKLTKSLLICPFIIITVEQYQISTISHLYNSYFMLIFYFKVSAKRC